MMKGAKYWVTFVSMLLVCNKLFAIPYNKDEIDRYRAWIYPAYKYNLEFWIAFLIGFSVLYSLLRKWLYPIICRSCHYLVCHRTLGTICIAILISVPPGIICRMVGDVVADDFLPIIWFPIIMVMTVVMQANSRFLKLLLESTRFVIILLIDLSAVCASLLFIILVNADLLSLPINEFRYLWIEQYYHPIDSCEEIWNPIIPYIGVIIFALMPFWIESACNWLKKLIVEKLWPILHNIKN